MWFYSYQWWPSWNEILQLLSILSGSQAHQVWGCCEKDDKMNLAGDWINGYVPWYQNIISAGYFVARRKESSEKNLCVSAYMYTPSNIYMHTYEYICMLINEGTVSC